MEGLQGDSGYPKESFFRRVEGTGNRNSPVPPKHIPSGGFYILRTAHGTVCVMGRSAKHNISDE
jgi:hypothetical protein